MRVLLYLPTLVYLFIGLCNPVERDADLPDWLQPHIEAIQTQPPLDPPVTITRWRYDGEIVYYIPVYRCCDFFSELYDEDGDLVCHPDGGIAGSGDGRCSDFFDRRRGGLVVWEDNR